MAKEIIEALLFGIATFTCILGGGVILLPLVGQAVALNIPVFSTIMLLVYRLPSIVVFVFPMSMLLATILTIGRFRSDSEITAFKASGISFVRLVIPIIVIGFLVSLFSIWFQEVIIPRSNKSAEDIIYNVTQKSRPNIKKNINFTEYDKAGLPLRVINVLGVKDNILQNITLAEYDEGVLVRLIRAATGSLVKNGDWIFYNGSLYVFDKNRNDKLLYVQFEKEYIHLPVNPLDLSKREKSVEEMNALELKEHISFKKRTGRDIATDLVKFHMRFSIPFTSVIFAILGASVGLKSQRNSSSTGLGLSLIVIIIYYLLISVGMYMGMTNLIPAIVAAWLPNLVIGTAGLYLLSRSSFL
jgi:lipopolysaccharide export system permease protein